VKAEDSGERILYLIKSQGPMTAKQLAEALAITTMGTRQHLAKLEQDNLVKTKEEKRPRGRPVSLWYLTSEGHGRFSDRHANLTVDLIATVEATFGKEGLDQVIDSRGQQLLDTYLAAVEGLSIQHRVEKLAELRSGEGYMATSIVQDDGTFLLLENHCPICAAANSCQGFCRSELMNFAACFEGLAEVERVEHILSGAQRCAYRITPI